MKLTKTLITALAFCGTSALADVCDPDDGLSPPLFEKAKTAFFEGDYQRFSDLMGPYFLDIHYRYDELFGPIDASFNGAWASCETVLRRYEEPGFKQELILYFDDEIDGPMTVLLIGAEVDGQLQMIEFWYDTSISVVLEGLR